MTVGLDDARLFLVDNWPGEVTNGPNPGDWTAMSATEDFPLGTKRMVYDDTNNGWATLMYLQFNNGTTAEPTVRSLLGIDVAASNADGSYYKVCNDGSEVNTKGPIAVALGTCVADYYGWFWVGGVCPVDTIAALGEGKYETEGNVTAGMWLIMVDGSSYCKFIMATATDFCAMSAFAMSADSTS